MIMKVVEQDGENQENTEVSSNEEFSQPLTLADEFKLEKKKEDFDGELSWLEYQEKEFSRIVGEIRTDISMKKQEIMFPEKYNNSLSKKLEHLKKVEKFFETSIEWSGDKMLEYKECFLKIQDLRKNLQQSIEDKTEYKVELLYSWIEGIALLMHSAPGKGIYEVQSRLELMEPFTKTLIQNQERIQDLQRLQQEITGIRADIDWMKEQDKVKEKQSKEPEKAQVDVPRTIEDVKRVIGEISLVLGRIEEQLKEEKTS